ncbi:MAG: carbonic anhydrase [Actinobacteria bacterium]|nr:carbonic anhydrase [Actinomycetota bacterium]
MSADRLSAQGAWDALVQGNQRFLTGRLQHPRQSPDRRSEIETRQTPTAAVLGCSDSRVPAEVVFDCGLGDLFVARNIGQIVDDTVIATMEFAVVELQVPLIVVKAHTSCGAVAATIAHSADPELPTTPSIANALTRIEPAVEQEWYGSSRDEARIDPALIDADAAGRRHVQAMIGELARRSEAIAAAVADGSVSLVGCQYRLDTGRVVPVSALGLVRI